MTADERVVGPPDPGPRKALRLSSQASVLLAWEGPEVPSLPRLQRRYQGVLPGCRTWDWRSGAGGVAFLAARSPGAAGRPVVGGSVVLQGGAVGPLLAWGVPYLLGRAVTDEDLRAAFDDPRAVDLLGRYVLAGLWVHAGSVQAGPRLVVGPDVTHTLVTCRRPGGARQPAGSSILGGEAGPGGRVWATRGRAALDAAGLPAAIAVERVPELVFFEYVLNGQELLVGVEPVEEATVHDGAGSRSWWPVAERLHIKDGSSPGMLREVLRTSAGAVCQAAEVHLALTAGRDSTLVASCLSGLAVQPRAALTFGSVRSPDMAGAAATAGALGWSHLAVPSSPALGPPGSSPEHLMSRLLERSVWTEGLDNAWNLVAPDFAWPVPHGAVLLTGSGGEAGRAFYWGAAPAWDDPVQLLSGWVGERLRSGPATRCAIGSPALSSSCGRWPMTTTCGCWTCCMCGAGYAVGSTGRCRSSSSTASWRPSMIPTSWPACSGCPSRTAVPAERSTRHSPPTRSSLRQSSAPPLRPAYPALFGSRPERLVARVRRRLRPADEGLTAIDHLHAALGHDRLTGRSLGPRWWERTRLEANSSGMHRRWLWNALAVDGFARSLV